MRLSSKSCIFNVFKRHACCAVSLLGIAACYERVDQYADESTVNATESDTAKSNTGSDSWGNTESAGGHDSSSSNSLSDTGRTDEEPLELDMIDDMEDGSGRISEQDGRCGVWYDFLDTDLDTDLQRCPSFTSPEQPMLPAEIPGARRNSYLAMYMGSCESFELCEDSNGWNAEAGIGFDLRFDGNTYRTFDASPFRGITFWGLSSENLHIALRLGSVQDTSTEEGAVCDGCMCDYSTADIPFTRQWRKYWVFFTRNEVAESDSAAEDFWTGPLNLSELFSIRFAFSFYEYEYKYPFDFWIDDIAFFKGRPDCGLDDTVCMFNDEEEDTDPPIL